MATVKPVRSDSSAARNADVSAVSDGQTREPGVTTDGDAASEEKDPSYPERMEQWGFLTGIATRTWVRKLVGAISGGTTGGGTIDTSKFATKDELTQATAKLATKDELSSEVAKLATKAELTSGYVTKAQYDELAARVTALEGSKE